VCDELHIDEAQRNKFRVLVPVGRVYDWLDDDRHWIVPARPIRNRLANLVGKVFSVAPEISLPELRRAIARARRLAVVPPTPVLAKFLETFGLATIRNNRAIAAKDFCPAATLVGTEATLFDVLRSHGPALVWDRFRDLCMAEGMNPITFSIYLSGSPIIARVAQGIYSLAGAHIPPGMVEELERETFASRKSPEWGWSPRGTLWYALRVNATVLTSGSIYVPSFLAEIAEGEWSPAVDGRLTDSVIKCNNRFLWGLRRPLLYAGAESGDVCILEFDISARKVSLHIGDEELADMWESGDGDAPAPELDGESTLGPELPSIAEEIER
jgi:hypothetical protein